MCTQHSWQNQYIKGVNQVSEANVNTTDKKQSPSNNGSNVSMKQQELELTGGDVLVSSVVHDVDGGNLLAVHLVAVHGVITTVHQAQLSVNSVKSSAVIGSVTGFVTKDFVHFFQSQTLGFRDHEEDEGGGEETHDAEEDEGAVVHGSDHVRGGLSDSEVVEPVRRGTDGDTLCSDTEREDFGNEDPCTRLERHVSKI